jgi:hypothetical protein
MAGRKRGGRILVKLVEEFYSVFCTGDGPSVVGVIQDSTKIAASYGYIVIISKVQKLSCTVSAHELCYCVPSTSSIWNAAVVQ